MIGQIKLKSQLERLLQSDSFPRFSIFIGERGSGRKTIIRNILGKLGILRECSIDVASVRDVIVGSVLSAIIRVITK